MLASNEESITQLSFDTHSKIADALRDFAHSQTVSTDPNNVNSQQSRISTQLERIIRQGSYSEQHDNYEDSCLNVSLISEEIAAVFAYAVWASSWLPVAKSRELAGRFRSAITKRISKYVIAPHLKDEVDVDQRLQVFSDLTSARRMVLHAAIAARYGSLMNALDAYSITGLPFVLFVHETTQTTEGNQDRDNAKDDKSSQKCNIYRSWKSLTDGCAVFQCVELGDAESVRTTIASKLKEAVKDKRTAPVLLVLKAELSGTVCAAAAVIRAICERYGVHFHVEGEALAMLLATSATERLMYNAGDLLRTAHSTLLHVSKWFGQFHTAVVLYRAAWRQRAVNDTNEGGYGKKVDDSLASIDEGEVNMLPKVMGLWYLLEKFQFARVTKAVESLYKHSVELAEALSTIPFLMDVHSVGCSSTVYISYCSKDGNNETSWAVNRAMLWLVKKCHTEVSQAISMEFHDGYERISFSPLRVIENASYPLSYTNQLGRRISYTLIRAAKQFELMLKGRATFLAEMRQCKDVEVESLPLLNAKVHSYALFFAALRVTPYGDVSRNGHWIRDEDMRSKVERLTLKLGNLLNTSDTSNVEGYLETQYDLTSVPAVFIGPKLPLAENDNVAEACDDETAVEMSNGQWSIRADEGMCVRLTEEWHFSEADTHAMAVEMATSVKDIITSILSAPVLEANEPTLSVEDHKLVEKTAESESSASEATSKERPHSESNAQVLINESIADEIVAVSPDQPEDDEVIGEGAILSEADARHSVEVPDTLALSADGGKPHKPAGIWGLLFGSKEDNEDDNSSGDFGTRELEDDYFRP